MLLSFNSWHLLIWRIKHSGRAKLRLQKKTSGENDLLLDMGHCHRENRIVAWYCGDTATLQWWHHDYRWLHQSILSRPTPKKKKKKVELTPKLTSFFTCLIHASCFYFTETTFLFSWLHRSLLLLQPCYFFFTQATSKKKKKKTQTTSIWSTSYVVILYRAYKKCCPTWIFIFSCNSMKPKCRFAISSSHQHKQYFKNVL